MKKILEYFKLKILVNKLMNRSNGLLTEEKVVHKIKMTTFLELTSDLNVLISGSNWRGIGAFVVLFEEAINVPHGVIIRHEYR